jgi:hypothetical protein
MNNMIESTLHFKQLIYDALLDELLVLPPALRPTHFNFGENEPLIPLADHRRVDKKLRGRNAGYCLYGPGFTYDALLGEGRTLWLRGELEIPAELVEELLIRLAKLQPIYGYATAPEERLARNRVHHQMGINAIEAWVGRNPAKWLPGLYWLNLISDEMAAQLHLPLDLLASAARTHLDLGNGLHLLRFYDRPEDWKAAGLDSRLFRDIPKLFDIEEVKRRLPAAKTFLELQDELNKW